MVIKEKQILLLFMLNRINRWISDCKGLIPTFTKEKVLTSMRTKRVVLNLMSNVLLQVVAAVINFILPRLFMTTYGSATNGLVSSIKQF